MDDGILRNYPRAVKNRLKMIQRCIDMGVVITRFQIEHIESLGLEWFGEEKAIRNMENEKFSRLIELIHEHDYSWRMSDDQRHWDRGYKVEKEIKDLLRHFLWDDVEPLIKEDWRRDSVKRMF